MIEAFCYCQTAILFSHFELEEKQSRVCDNKMGPAQPDRALEGNAGISQEYFPISQRRTQATLPRVRVLELSYPGRVIQELTQVFNFILKCRKNPAFDELG